MPPHRGRFVAYYRVSTQRQGESGLGLAAQRKAVEDFLNGGSWQLVGEFTEVESGKRSDRPQLAAALALCKRERAKLVIAKLDRLSRNLAFLATLMERGVDFIACDNPHATKLTIHILAAVAQHEREIDQSAHQGCACGSRRLAARSSAARSCGRRGRPRCACAWRRPTNAPPTSYPSSVMCSALVSRLTARSLKLSTIAGVATARGGQWHASTVRDALQRLEART